MPVQEAIPYSEAYGNGVSKSFALGFPCEKKEYLIVKVGDVQTSEWSLSNNTVTFTTAPELNAFIQFKRETKIERTTDYATYNDSLRGEVLNKDFDKVYEILQENKSDTTQYKPDYEYSVTKANEAHQIASEAYDLAELTEIEHGGTGARNINGARENLGIYSKGEVDALVATGGAGNVVLIEGGGTGADNAVDARENLSVYSKAETNAIAPNATEATAGKAKIATTAIAQTGVNDTDFLTAKKLRDALNAEGEAPISACRAWVCFNAKTTPPTILSSFNVSSVTKASAGNYEVFYTHEMPSDNYTFVLSLGNIADSVALPNAASIRSMGTPTSESIRLVSGNHFKSSAAEYFDSDFVSVVIF
ncbi:hypothetical protein P3S51_04100 [Acinetobacter sp. ANC 7201]|uniref:hypothetical protein n=1 Tax=Acinetobacter sp. ANC 7201 TaxID=3035288 RepID=UPI00279C6601|nr:hypothetical protein [Acinetobacter sp. ANC 7201]WFP97526.1 hypothetical protein P3S51_04100 [Acinetobacter sp. ANC 7201]